MSKKANKQFQNVKAHFFNSDNNSIMVEQVIDIFGENLETESGVYDLKDGERYYDEANGEIVYVYSIDLPAKVEATNLKRLRRSNALHRIFEYDVKRPPDLMKFVPYLIIIMLIIFK